MTERNSNQGSQSRETKTDNDKRGSASEKAGQAGPGVCEGVLSKCNVQELRWSHGANEMKRSEEGIISTTT